MEKKEMNIEVDLSQYFSTQELEAMSRQQQMRLKNIAQNYEIMLYMGLPAIKPDYMKGHAYTEKQVKLKEQISCELVKETNTFSDSDSDETCTLDMERKKTAIDKMVCDNQSFKTPKKRKLKNDDAIEQKVKRQRKSNDELLEKKVDELRERISTNFMHVEAPDDDHFLYCEDCNKEYDTNCTVHGPLDYIKDTEVYTENDPERALHTLPPGMVVQESSIVGAGLGVFTEEEIPAGVMFGPYGGMKIYDEVMGHDSGYCWQICTDGKPSHFVDAKDKAHSNWMRYINCAPSESEQNLVAFQFKGGIYYRSYKTISPQTELLCWYGNEYGRELGLVRDKNLLIRPKLVNGKDCYPCVFCKIAFTTAVNNVRHLVRIHGKDKLSQSDIQVLDEWLSTNGRDGYTKRKENKTQKVHFNNLKQRVTEQYKNCEQIKKIENISENESAITCNKNSTKQLMKEVEAFRCDVCDYTCIQSSTLKIHMAIHTGAKCFKCDVCNYACNKRGNLKRHMLIHTGEKRFKCDICNYACNQRGYLKTHMVLHTGAKCFKCNVCNYACNQRGNLKRHMVIHTGEKRFKCDICNYACNQRGCLKTHIMRIHTGEKCFECGVCSYASSESNALKTHMRIHTGEKCFKCNVCDYASGDSSALKKHMRKHTGEKCFKCDICSFSSFYSSSLKTHMTIHTGEKCFKCNVCDYASGNNSTLKTHMRIHTGERCFKCDVCDYASGDSSALKRHMKTHTQEKCFKCDICDYTCNQRNVIKIHMRKHTEML